MSKYSVYLLKIFTITLLFSNFPEVLGSEEIKKENANESDTKDWIELLKEEIREVDLKNNENKKTSSVDINENEFKEEKSKVNLNKNEVKEKKIIDEIGSGLSEKGINLDFMKNLTEKNKFGIRVNYLPENFFTHKNIYVDGRNVKAKYFGMGMLYQYKFLPPESRSNFYLQANADISNFKVFHNIDLTKETYSSNNLTLTCSACGNLTIQTDPNKIYFVPSISLGYKFKNTEKLTTNVSLGLQYISPGKLENFTDTEYPLPSYVQSRVDSWMKKTQDLIDSYSNIQPSINIGISYSF